ncbi:MAG TPA: response regulator transcription factor [Cyclobacteriaceae bacterium]|nr:MAG: response regulator containing a CheY-like receiver domain and an HTH DNA-binding domain protein [Bacteroidetes bacterium OLB12]HNT50615.1 response regulator transcription factor [Cyclobacteriaceae bacterium]
MVKIAITDDHLLVIKGLQDLLQHIPDLMVVGSFNNIETTRNNIGFVQPDVLFLDLNLPDGDGTQFCKELKKEYPQLKIIALTSFHQNILVKSVIRNGANGFLLKNTSLEELKNAIQTVLAGEQYIQREVKEQLLQTTLGQTPVNTFQPTLTRREKEILELIVKEHTTQQIADQLSVSVKTVEAHRSHLMDKLGVRNLAGLVKVALERGLC